MHITPLDSNYRIFQITDILPDTLVNNILELNWLDFPWVRAAGQEKRERRRIENSSSPVLESVATFITDNLIKIEDALGVKFTNTYPYTSWWYDEPGYDIGIHTDGHLPAAMQLFWIAPGKQFATQFYRSKIRDDIITQIEFVTNTGYIMLNMPNENGSQPLHWHGMLNTVPANTFRLTSYTTLGTYTHK